MKVKCTIDFKGIGIKIICISYDYIKQNYNSELENINV